MGLNTGCDRIQPLKLRAEFAPHPLQLSPYHPAEFRRVPSMVRYGGKEAKGKKLAPRRIDVPATNRFYIK